MNFLLFTSTPNLYQMGQNYSHEVPRDWHEHRLDHRLDHHDDFDYTNDAHRYHLASEGDDEDDRQPRARSLDRSRRRLRSRKRLLHDLPPPKGPSSFFLSPITSNEEQNDTPNDTPNDNPNDKHYHGYPKEYQEYPKISEKLEKYTDYDSVYHKDDTLYQYRDNDGDFPVEKEVFDEPFSPLLSLPLEILYTIIEIVYYDDTSISINSNLENFSNTIPLLLKKIHQLSLCFLYKYAIFNRPHSFDKFLTNLVNNPTIGKYVEYMDFQQFTSIGLGRTGRMNQEIQMVTSETIARALSLTPNLIEFMASENIQDDMDVNVLDRLFNHCPHLQTVDFCGASSEDFVAAFRQLTIGKTKKINQETNQENNQETYQETNHTNQNNQNNQTLGDSQDVFEMAELHPPKSPSSSLSNLMKVSFHDCSSLTPDIFAKILPSFSNLTRLDLNHTSITSTILLNHLPHSCRLTHLSLARCSQLTTKDLINFLTLHPAVANNSLQWLNLQIDSNVVSPLSDVYLLYTLRYLKAPGLQYLNLGGLPVDNKILTLIKNKFSQLQSLSLCHAAVTFDELLLFLKDNDQVLKFLDITGVKNLSRWNLTHLLKTVFNSSLIALEYDYKILYDLTSKGQHVKVTPVQQTFIDPVYTPQVWKFYDNEGRRAWIYKLDESDSQYSSIINQSPNTNPVTSNLVYYDLETGNKIVSKVKKPGFLKYASRKINCSIGYYNMKNAKKLRKNRFQEEVWPQEVSQRGIYNYYSLNVK